MGIPPLTINSVYETKAATPPFQGTIGRAATWLRKMRKLVQYLYALGTGAGYVDDEELFDARAPCLDSTFISPLLASNDMDTAPPKHFKMKARHDARIEVLRAAYMGTSSAGRRTWVIGETTDMRLSSRISR